MLQNNFVVTLEGNPGAGKTTIKDELKLEGIEIERIDQILPDNPNSDKGLLPADIVASDLLKSSRLQKYKNKLVVMDRYIHSTLAYQYAYDRTHSTSNFDDLANTYNTLQDLGYLTLPDLTIYIDVPPHLSVSRKNRKNDESSWTDKAFLDYMREYYRSRSDIDYIIDGIQDYLLVYNEIVAVIMKEVKNHAQ